MTRPNHTSIRALRRSGRILGGMLERLEDRCTPAVSAMPDELVLAVRAELPVTDLGGYLARLGPASRDIASADPLLSIRTANGYESLFHLHLSPGSNLSATANAMSANSFVAWVQPNFRYDGEFRDFTPNDPQYSSQYHHPLMQNNLAWDVSQGAGVIVAVTDDGVSYTHEDLAVNMWSNTKEVAANGVDDDANGYIDDLIGWDFSSNDSDPAPIGADLHGTHVAGIVAARTDNTTGVSGTAGLATVMPVRFYGSGAWTSTVILNSYKYAVDNGAKIVSTSYNVDGFVNNSTFRTAVQYVYDKGAIHFNSAGNNGQLNPPRQAFDQMLFVANTTSSDTLFGTSNYGTGVDIAAPGSSILSTVPTNKYSSLTGTSMSAPNAAGAAAVLWSAHPEWTREQVVARLVGLADNIDAQNPGFVGLLGGGRVNARAALLDPLPAPQIGGINEVPSNGTILFAPPTTFTVRLPEKLLISSVATPGNWQLTGDGSDNKFGTGDDVKITLTPSYTTQAPSFYAGSNQIKFNFAALAVDRYQFRGVSGGLTDPFGVALDGDANGSAGGDFVREFFVSAAGKVTGHSPVGTTIAPVTTVTISFANTMNTGSFAVASDVVAFTGPNGDLKGQITGFNWVNSVTLQIATTGLGTAGAYSMVLGPEILSAVGVPCDNDADGTAGESIDDRYTAAFTIPATSVIKYKSEAFAYDSTLDLVAGTTGVVTLTAISSADDAFIQLPMGSDKFRFYGTEYSGSNQLFVSSNGLITLGSGNDDYENGDLTAIPTQRTIAAYWDDLITSRNSAPDDLVLCKFLDVDSNLVNDLLVVEWNEVRHISGSTTNGYTFQMLLQLNTGSASGDIRFNYRDLDIGSTSLNNGGSATVGVKDIGTQGPGRLLIHQNSTANPLVQSGKAIRVYAVPNIAPTANPGGPYSVAVGVTVPLNGAGSTDPDEPLSYLWYQWDLDNDGVYGETGAGAVNGDELGSTPTFAAGALAAGTAHPIGLRVTDSSGAKHTAGTTVTVASPPSISDVVTGDGSAQRSRVTSLTVTFSQVVTLGGSAFTLAGPGGNIALAVDTNPSTPTETIAVLTFSGAGTEFDSLADGNYTLSVAAGQVAGNFGMNLDGNGDGAAGDDFVSPTAPNPGAIFRLFGDGDGDRDVDSMDFLAFRGTNGLNSGDPGFNPHFDFDFDGDVDSGDFLEFRARFGTSV